MSSNKLIIDVREPHEYQAGHAQDSINIPLNDLMADMPILKNTPLDRPIVVYCRTGNRSAQAVNLLNQMGYMNVANGINTEQINKQYNA